MRHLSLADRVISQLDTSLRAMTSSTGRRPGFSYQRPDTELSEQQRAKSASLMRVNHCGEVCAQALYHGQALTARDEKTRAHLLRAAEEEAQHLGWCQSRLDELNDHASHLNPLWYASSFSIGAVTGLLGNPINLGFVAATEEEVCKHIDRHLQEVPEQDLRSREILSAMRADELRHQSDALDQGGRIFPTWVKSLMALSSKAMTLSTRVL
ncbi:MAG: 2-polyprenyl-3-methyl-6-methoxy-1,4-benzoquinone monooxygenase [Pseudomonadales bacterium]|jgi:ubiquinone biosynthesis monooxygenase Coq7